MRKTRVKSHKRKTKKGITIVKSHLREKPKKKIKESKKKLNYYRQRRKSLEDDIISGRRTKGEAKKFLKNVNEFIDQEIDKLSEN